MTRQIQEIAVAVVTAVAGFGVDNPGFAGYVVVTAVAGFVVDDPGFAGYVVVTAAVAGVVVDDDGFVGVADIAADIVAALNQYSRRDYLPQNECNINSIIDNPNYIIFFLFFI